MLQPSGYNTNNGIFKMLLIKLKCLANIVGVQKQIREMESLLDFLVDNIF